MLDIDGVLNLFLLLHMFWLGPQKCQQPPLLYFPHLFHLGKKTGKHSWREVWKVLPECVLHLEQTGNSKIREWSTWVNVKSENNLTRQERHYLPVWHCFPSLLSNCLLQISILFRSTWNMNQCTHKTSTSWIFLPFHSLVWHFKSHLGM